MGPQQKSWTMPRIRRHVLNHLSHSNVIALVKTYGLATVCSTTRALVTDKVFESPVAARDKFPELFHASAYQNADRVVSTVATAEEHVKLIEDDGKRLQE